MCSTVDVATFSHDNKLPDRQMCAESRKEWKVFKCIQHQDSGTLLFLIKCRFQLLNCFLAARKDIGEILDEEI